MHCCYALAGANLDVDVPWKWLNFFLEDDAKLEQVRRAVLGGGRLRLVFSCLCC